MVSRLALSRLAPVLNVARASSSAASRRVFRGARPYSTSDNDNTVSLVASCYYIHFLT